MFLYIPAAFYYGVRIRYWFWRKNGRKSIYSKNPLTTQDLQCRMGKIQKYIESLWLFNSNPREKVKGKKENREKKQGEKLAKEVETTLVPPLPAPPLLMLLLNIIIFA